MNWLFNVTINDISVIYVTAHRCAGGLKKKFDLRSGSQRHRHFAGFFNVPVQAPTRDQPFYTVIHKRVQYNDTVNVQNNVTTKEDARQCNNNVMSPCLTKLSVLKLYDALNLIIKFEDQISECILGKS